ncbi:anti-anti-sigma factor [Prauserella shujinwangii]|uniref:Anti-sigma factor antagonist n=1 Tax=Prauserella shujinwangii TaxID=1453103 RepID=A0A2T0M2H0_9PSEU|nr:STAS domain-containing protein [Prauserella shujinwangii]PRX50938.1 anti-anti-sigma factor [Prauserella shujinwangii]
MSEVCRVTTDQVGSVVVARLAGEIDVRNAVSVEARLVRVVDEAAGAVVLDLRGVTFLASSGLSMLVRVHERCRERDLPWHLVAATREVLRPLEVTGLRAELPVVDSVEAALAAGGVG